MGFPYGPAEPDIIEPRMSEIRILRERKAKMMEDVTNIFVMIDEYGQKEIADISDKIGGLSKTFDDVADELKEIDEQLYKILIYDTESDEFERKFKVDCNLPSMVTKVGSKIYKRN